MKQHSRFAALALAGTLLCGCAATPESGSVTGKNDGVFQQNMTNPATAPLEETLDYDLTFPSKDGTVEYTIRLSRDLFSQPLPIVEAVPDFFTGEEVRNICQVLLPEAVWREQVHVSDPQYSKEELRYKIQWMTQLATQEGMADLYGPAEYEGQYDDSIDHLKTAIQRYTVMLETAPEENPRALCDWTFRDGGVYTEPSYGDRVIQATTRMGELEYYVYCTVYDKADYHQNRLFVQLGNSRDYLIYNRLHAMVCRTEKPTQDQIDAAAEKAQALLDAMGKGDWRVTGASVEVMDQRSRPEYEILVRATQEFLGAPVSGNQPAVNLFSESTTAPYLNSEAILSFAGDGTLVYLDMCCPVALSGVINESAATLPMEELMEKAQEQLSLQGLEETRDYYFLSYYYDGSVTCQVELTDVEFRLQRIPVPGKDYTYYYVPALAFSGTTRYYDQATGAPADCIGVTPDRVSTLLWLNAVDGSVIAVDRGPEL